MIKKFFIIVLIINFYVMLETQTKTPRDVGLKVARLHVAESGEVRSV